MLEFISYYNFDKPSCINSRETDAKTGTPRFIVSNKNRPGFCQLPLKKRSDNNFLLVITIKNKIIYAAVEYYFNQRGVLMAKSIMINKEIEKKYKISVT